MPFPCSFFGCKCTSFGILVDKVGLAPDHFINTVPVEQRDCVHCKHGLSWHAAVRKAILDGTVTLQQLVAIPAPPSAPSSSGAANTSSASTSSSSSTSSPPPVNTNNLSSPPALPPSSSTGALNYTFPVIASNDGISQLAPPAIPATSSSHSPRIIPPAAAVNDPDGALVSPSSTKHYRCTFKGPCPCSSYSLGAEALGLSTTEFLTHASPTIQQCTTCRHGLMYHPEVSKDLRNNAVSVAQLVNPGTSAIANKPRSPDHLTSSLVINSPTTTGGRSPSHSGFDLPRHSLPDCMHPLGTRAGYGASGLLGVGDGRSQSPATGRSISPSAFPQGRQPSNAGLSVSNPTQGRPTSRPTTPTPPPFPGQGASASTPANSSTSSTASSSSSSSSGSSSSSKPLPISYRCVFKGCGCRGYRINTSLSHLNSSEQFLKHTPPFLQMCTNCKHGPLYHPTVTLDLRVGTITIAALMEAAAAAPAGSSSAVPLSSHSPNSLMPRSTMPSAIRTPSPKPPPLEQSVSFTELVQESKPAQKPSIKPESPDSENAPKKLWSGTEPPPDMLCPITQELMIDPVVLADGHSYEQSAIMSWLEKHDVSPMTGDKLPHKNPIPNLTLKKLIISWKDEHPTDGE